jgi:hypothetical protein
VLERDVATRKVNKAARLDNRPLLAALSRAVGTPAFAISQLVFVFVEGEERLGERERFRRLSVQGEAVRFMEAGSYTEVIRRVGVIKALENEAEGGIRIGGILDRDFRSNSEAQRLRQDSGLYVLAVHEIENLFLHPVTVRILLRQNGRNEADYEAILRAGTDGRAGAWIFQCGTSTQLGSQLPEIPSAAKDTAKSLAWADFEANSHAAIQSVLDRCGYSPENQVKFRRVLDVSKRIYERKRNDAVLWKICEGKEVLRTIAGDIGFADANSLIQAANALWAQNPANLPDELVEMREYLSTL